MWVFRLKIVGGRCRPPRGRHARFLVAQFALFRQYFLAIAPLAPRRTALSLFGACLFARTSLRGPPIVTVIIIIAVVVVAAICTAVMIAGITSAAMFHCACVCLMIGLTP